MKLILSVFMLFGVAQVQADELDNEKQVTNIADRTKDLPATLIVRKNEKTGEVEVAHLKQEVIEQNLDKAVSDEVSFTLVATDKIYSENNFGELDSDNSRESWYFYFGYTWNNFYPTYNYYGSYYQYYSYYTYRNAGYAYSYYRPYYRSYYRPYYPRYW